MNNKIFDKDFSIVLYISLILIVIILYYKAYKRDLYMQNQIINKQNYIQTNLQNNTKIKKIIDNLSLSEKELVKEYIYNTYKEKKLENSNSKKIIKNVRDGILIGSLSGGLVNGTIYHIGKSAMTWGVIKGCYAAILNNININNY